MGSLSIVFQQFMLESAGCFFLEKQDTFVYRFEYFRKMNFRTGLYFGDFPYPKRGRVSFFMEGKNRSDIGLQVGQNIPDFIEQRTGITGIFEQIEPLVEVGG